MQTKLDNIRKANNLLLGKINELQDYLQNYTFSDFKENEKIVKIPLTESGKNYIEKKKKEIESFKKVLKTELENLNNENYNLFIKKLINNYAKFEDDYFTLLAESKNELGAVMLFKIENKLLVLKQKLEFENSCLNKINLEEKVF